MPEESVKVVVRIKPILDKQKYSSKTHEFFTFDENDKQILIEPKSEQKSSKIYCFDDIFSAGASQESIYEKTGMKMVKEVLQGYNCTIFAYGQTGSGKTHTMMGKQGQKGIIPRCFQEILDKAKSNSNKDFLVMCSYIELYNEELRDLLNFSNSKQKLELRESPDNGIFIKDIKKPAITSEQDMMKYLKMGNQNRTTAETLMNSQSSRSHSIFTIYVESLEKKTDGTDKLVGSKFNLVDLAGSQRQSKTGSIGDRFIEATKINLSLTALGKVITSLVQGKGTFIPYRDSKLTRLLQDSLGGNAKTLMIATISSHFSNYDETISTLKYASRAKYITNAPVINLDPKDALLLEYENQIKRLRVQLKQIQRQEMPVINELKEQNQKLAKLADQQKKQLQDKIRALEKQVISPNELSQQLLNERNRREQKLSFMEKNYKNLEEEVKEMRELLTELRRKYKNASKEIFQLENEHERERQQIQEQCEEVSRENAIFKSVLNVLFTQKQLNNLISLGRWQSDGNFKLPNFYFKDRHTLAFPCGDQEQSQKQKENGPKKTCTREKVPIVTHSHNQITMKSTSKNFKKRY